MIFNGRSPILAGLMLGAAIGVALWAVLGGSLWLRVGTTVLAATLIGVVVKAARRFGA